jgi:hypothetical protein
VKGKKAKMTDDPVPETNPTEPSEPAGPEEPAGPVQPALPPESVQPPAPDVEEKALRKKRDRRDFWIGFIGSIVGNLVLALIFGALSIVYASAVSRVSEQGNTADIVFSILLIAVNILPWVVNIAVIVVSLVKHRSGIALGMLASYGLAIALATIAGVLFVAYCFISSSR